MISELYLVEKGFSKKTMKNRINQFIYDLKINNSIGLRLYQFDKENTNVWSVLLLNYFYEDFLLDEIKTCKMTLVMNREKLDKIIGLLSNTAKHLDKAKQQLK